MNKKERDRIVEELKAQGHITTDERLAILKMKMEDVNTPIKIKFQCISLIQKALDGSMDIDDWFKELVSLTDDVIRSQEYVKKG